MKTELFWQKILRALYHYALFFLLVALMVSVTMSIFVGILAHDLNLTLTGDNLNRAAKITFLAVIALGAVFTAIDVVRRRFTTRRAAQHIADAAKQIVQGNFDVRIAPIGRLGVDECFNEIIDCFNSMAQELQSVETLRTDFVANVSHEMKTPLSVMQNYAQLLLGEKSEEKRSEYAREIADASRRMADMMTNILRLNRLENQKIYPNISQFDLGEQLFDCLLSFESVWEKAQIEIEAEIAEDVRICADAQLLTIVWNNLFSNAFKFTGRGGKVGVHLTADAEFAVVRVSDTGCGMSAEVGAHIFEKFYQGDTSHSVRGNGLGLALVKRVVDILNAEISVESTLGVGTTFTVRLRRE